MPIHQGKDQYGNYFQFGISGKRYYFVSKNRNSIQLAYNAVLRQARAIEASKFRRR
jgi:hypothetical protein